MPKAHTAMSLLNVGNQRPYSAFGISGFSAFDLRLSAFLHPAVRSPKEHSADALENEVGKPDDKVRGEFGTVG